MKDHEHDTVCTSCSINGECSCGHEHGGSCASCDHDHGHSHDETSWTNTVIIGLIIATGIVLEYLGVGGHASTVILVAAMIASGYKMAINGVRGLLKGNIGIDFLVTVAAVGAALIGQYQEAALVVFLKDISLKLEVIASERARHAIEAPHGVKTRSSHPQNRKRRGKGAR